MTAILLSAIMGLTAIAELIFYAFKDRSTSFILSPAFSNVGRIDHFIDLQVVTLNGASCSRPLETIYEKGCYFNQTNIPRLFISLARFIGVGKEDTLWVGVAIGAIAIAAVLLAYALCLRQWRLVMATACGLLLYPFRLALERGNIDLIILIILIILIFSGFLAAARPPSVLKTSLLTGLFVMGSLGKVYPLLLTPLLILNYKEIVPGRLSFLAAVIPMAIASASFAGLWPDLHAMLRESYKDVEGGLSYGLATLVEPSLDGIGLLGLKLALIILIASSALSASDPFGIQSLACTVRRCLASTRFRDRLAGILFVIGGTLLAGTYFIFINGIYRISVPFLLILPAIIQSLRFGPASANKPGQTLSDPQSISGVSFLLVIIVCIGVAGYRPYDAGSNLQHYTNLFLNLILIPSAIGAVGSALALALFPGSSPGRLETPH